MDLDQAFHELRRRNESVPRPPRLPTSPEVDQMEGRLAVSFHPDFRRFLLEVSDVVYGTIEPATITQPGAHNDLIKVAEKAWGGYGVPRGLLPICEDNADFYCMNTAGEIVFWSHNGWSPDTWPNLARWITDVWLGAFVAWRSSTKSTDPATIRDKR